MSTQTKFQKISLLDIEVDKLGMSQAADEISRLIKTKKSYYIVKPYVEFFDKSKQTNETKSLINNAYLCLPDGVSLNWAAYYKNKTNRRRLDVVSSLAKIVFSPAELHVALPNHSWGTNFTYTLLKQAEEKGHTVFLVGSPKASTILNTKKYLLKHMPKLNIVGTFNGRDGRVGYFTEAMEVELTKIIKSTQPDIVLVGLGFPLQERVVAKLAGKFKHGVFIGEGGTFDFTNFGGKISKAPIAMQRMGLEWLWRLYKEPSRLKRQLAIPKFIYEVYRYYK